jgi:hypothetical protein
VSTVVEARETASGAPVRRARGRATRRTGRDRRTLAERCEAAADALADAEHGVAWCHLNDESALLTHLIPGAVELSGSDSVDSKEDKLHAFSDGQIRVLVTKPSLGAWGLNWQHATG